MRFGRLVVQMVTRRVKPDPKHIRTYWLCLCDCGAQKEIVADSLLGGHSNSCGCLFREVNAIRTHGLSDTPTYKIWCGIKKRCYQKQSSVYYKYGGRGIRMCARWKNDFETFLEDMGERPAGLTIERKDVNGNYEPGNCTWVTSFKQASNRRNTVRAYPNESLSETARRVGVNYKYLHKLYRVFGLSIEEAIKKALSSRREILRRAHNPKENVNQANVQIAA